MAVVPYKPVPEVAPSKQGLPSVGLETPVAAFGGAVAQATEHLGQIGEQAGNELFGRAVALQQLNNETEAREADTKYMIDVGNMHAQFSALEGKAAVDAAPKYFKDLDDLRVKYRTGLSNDMARRMFDSSALSTMGRTIFNGAGHAATENKHWAIGTATAQMDLYAKTVGDNPQDDVLFHDQLRKVRESAGQVSELKGFDPGGPQARDTALKAESLLWEQRIIGLSRTDPFKAATMLDEHKTELTQPDFLKVDNAVRAQGRAVGSVNIANSVYAEGIASGASLGDMEKQAEAKAKEMAPNDPILAKHTVDALRGKFNQDKYASRQEEIENKSVVDQAIMNGVRNEQELRLDPTVAKAIDRLPKDKQLGIPGQINRYNAARDKITNQDTEQRVYGLSKNDRESFLNLDLTKEGLSQGDMKKYRALQDKMKESPATDPRLSRSLGWIRNTRGPELEALGIFKRTDSNKDDYDHYTGALASAIDIYVEAHGKSPDYKTVIDEIAPQIIKQRSEPYFFGLLQSKKPFFQQDMDKALKWGADLKKDEPDVSDEQIYRAYIRAQLIDLHGKKKSDGK